MLNNDVNQSVPNSEMPHDIFRNPTPSKSLPIWQKFVLFFGGSIGLIVVSIFGSLIAKSLNLGSVEELNGAANYITYALLFLALLGVLNFNVIKVGKDRIIPNLFIGIGLGVSMIVVPIFYQSIVAMFKEPSISENEAGLRSFLTIYPFWSILILGFIGPICEELTYRVGLFSLLKKRRWLAYVVSSIVFAMMHFGFDSADIVNEFINLPIYLFSGFTLAFAYDFFGFWGSLAAHVTNNLYSVIMVLLISKLGIE